ncbi:eukaryotic translation initiation factor 3 subunit C-like [Hydractinia symbiolongicarpus]|uniref:eukaryotic translation initiation factor 3 subunit C-like n=1 Tax=Hydractinia symbiolongicarpus TaxID=13093 RepID=UPI00254DA7C5|nr:eukaryotic translation initiation factor 3 subunit C-like [Hydractinia symbiolongicarpus]
MAPQEESHKFPITCHLDHSRQYTLSRLSKNNIPLFYPTQVICTTSFTVLIILKPIWKTCLSDHISACDRGSPTLEVTLLFQILTPFCRVYQFSDDEDDTKRVVCSAKDKRFDILQTTIKYMRNSMKINDIAKIQTEYENLTKEYDKSKNVVEREGIPNFYVKCLADLEDYLQQQWEDTKGRKKLHKLNAKALASLRQKLKKYNRNFEAKIEEYRADPDKFEEDEVEEEEADKTVSGLCKRFCCHF